MTDERTAALRAIQRAVKRREAAKLAVDKAIVDARESGCTLKAIAEAAGVTHPQVINILRRYT